MGRRAIVDAPDLMQRLAGVFSDVGYEGATLAMLAEASGLQKASLYHRFPNGKEQMAREVLLDVWRWIEENILIPLRGEGPPLTRIVAMVEKLNALYAEGRQSCLLNMLSSSRVADGPFREPIKNAFEAWIDTLSSVLEDAGIERSTARKRAERMVMLLQGSLVLSRGLGSTKPFLDFLASAPDELLHVHAETSSTTSFS